MYRDKDANTNKIRYAKKNKIRTGPKKKNKSMKADQSQERN